MPSAKKDLAREQEAAADPADAGNEIENEVETPVDLQTGEEAAESTEDDGAGAGAGESQDGQGDGGTAEGEGASSSQPETTTDEFEIVLEGEKPSPSSSKDTAHPWVKEVRRQNKVLKEKIEHLERQLGGAAGANIPDPGPKPTWESCGYDEPTYEKKVAEWNQANAQRQQVIAQQAQAQEAEKQEWQGRLSHYETKKAEIVKGIPKFKEAEDVVRVALNEQQRAVIIKCAKNPAMVVAALGQRPELLKDFESAKDVLAFAHKVGELEGKLKMAKKTQAPPPERKIQGSGSKTGAVDSQLEKLREQAARTGDYTKVREYKQQKKG